MNEDLLIRPVRIADAAAIAEIYWPFVTETAISFEIDPPTANEFAERIERTTSDYPWLVAAIEGMPVGYAYATAHRARAAYRFSVETSVYVDSRYHRRGIARQLYDALFAELVTRQFCNAYAGITLPNEASQQFHLEFGFRSIGVFPNVGFKFERWHDVAWFHRPCSDAATG